LKTLMQQAFAVRPFLAATLAATLCLSLLMAFQAEAWAGDGDAPINERLEVAGMSVSEAEHFLQQLQQAVRQDDRAAVAALADYPIRAAAGDNTLTLKDAADFVAHYPAFMTPALVGLIEQARLDDLFANYQGAMIGNGALWFGPVCKKDGEPQALAACKQPPIRLITINGAP
jgi:hypothetical protein